MKKTRLSLFFLLMLFTATSCSSNNTDTDLDPKNPVSIDLWHYYTGDNQATLEKMVDEFNHSVGASSGVLVNVISKGGVSELEEALTNSAKGVINSEEMPNIFSCYLDKLVELDSYDKVADLNNYFSEDDINLYVTDFITSSITSDGRLLSIPIAKSTEVLYINITSFQKFLDDTGYDINKLKTWDGVYNTSREYYNWVDAQTPETKWDGESFLGIDSLANYIIVGNQQLGTEIINSETNSILINQDSMKKIFEIYYKGMSLEYFNAVRAFSSDDVKAKDILAYVGSTSSASYFPRAIEINNTEEPIELEAMLYPSFNVDEFVAIQQGAGMSIAQSAPAKEEGSAIFLKWLTDPERNIIFSVDTGYLPVETSAYNSELLSDNLENLKTSDQMEQNIYNVYSLATKQIMELGTYSPPPFLGSYNARNILASTLSEVSTLGKEKAINMKAQGYSEEEIIETLDVDSAFKDWISKIEAELTKLSIPYVIE